MITNGYTTLQSIKDVLKISIEDTADDLIIEDLINETSRYIDSYTSRRFYPRIETRSYGVPKGRGLWLDDDLLTIISLTNGNGDSVTSAEYNTEPANYYPKFAVVLKESTSTYWQGESDADYEQTIDLAAWWGCRTDFTVRGWVTGTTLNEGGVLNATDTSFTVTNKMKFKPGQVIKIESEIMNVAGVSGLDINVNQRGDNGSTAATHADGSTVYIWSVEPQIELATRLIVNNLYHNRFGNNTTATATVTGAGVVLAPDDIPASAEKILRSFKRLV